jgi:hypothetical protein
MTRFYLKLIVALHLVLINNVSSYAETLFPLASDVSHQDTIPDNQDLYNGRIWRNTYYQIEGDQFLFTDKFLPGSVTMRGKTFNNVMIRYDILKDEINIPVIPWGIVQLNKEMTDSFSFVFENKTYRFARFPDKNPTGLEGYCQFLYGGKTFLFVRYSKYIVRSSSVGKNDRFYQISRTYFVKDSLAHQVKGKHDLLKVLYDDKKVVRNIIRENKLDISGDPESMVPLISYIDRLR